MLIPVVAVVTRFGEVANTAEPVPVSSESEVASCDEVMEPDFVL